MLIQTEVPSEASARHCAAVPSSIQCGTNTDIGFLLVQEFLLITTWGLWTTWMPFTLPVHNRGRHYLDTDAKFLASTRRIDFIHIFRFSCCCQSELDSNSCRVDLMEGHLLLKSPFVYLLLIPSIIIWFGYELTTFFVDILPGNKGITHEWLWDTKLRLTKLRKGSSRFAPKLKS